VGSTMEEKKGGGIEMVTIVIKIVGEWEHVGMLGRETKLGRLGL
jgi:hypothetical protein